MAEETPPTLPTVEPVTLAAVKVWLDYTDDTQDAALAPIVAAVCSVVRGLPVASRALGATEWPGSIAFGALLLVARLWRRKDTPGGVEAYGDFGVAYVRRNDPDVAMMLELGDESRPAVG